MGPAGHVRSTRGGAGTGRGLTSNKPKKKVWYAELDAAARRLFPRGGADVHRWRYLGFKVAADTFVFGAAHVAAAFLFQELVISPPPSSADGGGRLAAAAAKLRADFGVTFAAAAAVWPAVQLANFAAVPVRHQLLAVNVAGLADAAFLAFAKTSDMAALLRSALRRPEPDEGGGRAARR